jgi:hypothetical protein
MLICSNVVRVMIVILMMITPNQWLLEHIQLATASVTDVNEQKNCHMMNEV